MGAKRCDEDLTEVLCDLAHAIRDQTKVAQAQFEWFQSHLNCVTVQQLQSELGKVKEIIMAGQADAAAQIKAATKQITEAIGADIDTLVEQVKTLTDALANQDSVSPELQSAVDELTATVNAVDAKYPIQTA